MLFQCKNYTERESLQTDNDSLRYQRRSSHHAVPLYNLVLQPGWDLDEIVAVPTHSYEQVSVFFGLDLGLLEHLVVDYIELYLLSSLFEVRLYQSLQFVSVCLTAEEGRGELHVPGDAHQGEVLSQARG